MKVKKILKQTIYTILSLSLAALMLPQASFAASREKVLFSLQQSGTIGEVKKIDISLSKVKKSYHYLVINDSHIIIDSDELTDKKTIASRASSFKSKSGRASNDTFPSLMNKVDSMKLNGIILNGDIIDEYTAANLKAVYDATKNVHTPVFYLRSDHDTKNWWADKTDTKKAATYAKKLGMEGGVITKTDGEIILVGWNDSYKSMNSKQEERLVKVMKGSKPVILFSHVPFATSKPRGFKAFVKKCRNECIFWGRGGIYNPNAATADLINFLNSSKASPAAVICGHIHYEYSGQLKGGIPEYICPPFFEGSVTLVTVH